MAESGSWASIKENGLFSTSALLDRFKITGDRRQDLETKQRKESVVIGHFPSGPAMIRDQIPLNEGALGKVVDGMDAVDRIRRVETGNQGGHQNVPVKDVVIKSARRVQK